MAFNGSRKIYQQVFETTPTLPAENKQKGRSSSLHNRRNELLIDRYLFYGLLTDKKYTSLLETLEFEFHLSQSTIADLIADNLDKLVRTKKAYGSEKPERLLKLLADKWPHMVWCVK